MNTSFKVNGKKSGSSAIAHIERNHSLLKNPTQSISESSNIERPHIIIFKKAIKKKIEKPIISRSQISRKIETYKSRIRKAKLELEKLEDEKKILSKKATILRNEKKVKLLTIQKNLTEKQKTGFAVEFVDIPFSITKCPPGNLSKKDFKKLSDIAIETTLKLFDIDKNELASTAHLDQASAHVHITFNVPNNINLKDITNMNYREAQIIFNKKIREAFPHLKIDKICSKLNEPNKYLPLSKYKRKCVEKKQQKEFQKVSDKKQSFQEALKQIKPDAKNNLEVVKYVDKLKIDLKATQGLNRVLTSKVTDLEVKGASRTTMKQLEDDF
ncbi:MAG: hypothetical protein U9Q27_03595, partial [Patescibacteria group bacterium]|nr:hypothetical protein [Patescibacteria group bacterium]